MAPTPAAAAGPEADAPAAANVDVEMGDADQLADDGGWQGEDEGVRSGPALFMPWWRLVRGLALRWAFGPNAA